MSEGKYSSVIVFSQSVTLTLPNKISWGIKNMYNIEKKTFTGNYHVELWHNKTLFILLLLWACSWHQHFTHCPCMTNNGTVCSTRIFCIKIRRMCITSLYRLYSYFFIVKPTYNLILRIEKKIHFVFCHVFNILYQGRIDSKGIKTKSIKPNDVFEKCRMCISPPFADHPGHLCIEISHLHFTQDTQEWIWPLLYHPPGYNAICISPTFSTVVDSPYSQKYLSVLWCFMTSVYEP